MNKIGFQLKKINTHQFAFIDDAYDDENEEFNLETNISFGIDPSNSAIKSSVKIQFEQNDKAFLIIEVSCEFNIDPKIWKDFTNEKTVKIPKRFMAHLAVITVGTTRGVLHSKTENTRYNEFILPTLNVADMVQEDVEFKK
ncbi:hypothetical protein [Salegentibacter maritimus]|uniref:Preprotein translocase subunit SecB n=1 Tax=Salegentibacter maritimus TaxID=2794347 RepID=A0ABS0THN0_9FLAO|nr:hypothetical protein [Salegentibacter maritimus]MBI6119493.1 hypothetical protein [Salegentibacter maritimus]